MPCRVTQIRETQITMTRPRRRKSRSPRGGGRTGARRRGSTIPASPPRPGILADARAFALRPTRSAARSSGARRRSQDARRSGARPTGPTLPGLPAVVRGASSGFSVLLAGELLGIIFLSGAAVGVLVTFVGLAGFAFAGNRAGGASAGQPKRAARDGMLAAVGAWLLTLPLRIAAQNAPDLRFVAVQLAFAAAVGGLAGIIVARAAARSADGETRRG